MSIASLLVSAGVIKNEILTRANTALRIGSMFEDIINYLNSPLKYVAKIDLTISLLASGTLVIGKEYVVPELFGADNLTNCGFVDIYTPFIATATTPTDWGNGTKVYDMEASQPTILTKIDTVGVTSVEFVANYDDGAFEVRFNKTGGFLINSTVILNQLVGTFNFKRFNNNYCVLSNDNSNIVNRDVSIEVYP